MESYASPQQMKNQNGTRSLHWCWRRQINWIPNFWWWSHVFPPNKSGYSRTQIVADPLMVTSTCDWCVANWVTIGSQLMTFSLHCFHDASKTRANPCLRHLYFGKYNSLFGVRKEVVHSVLFAFTYFHWLGNNLSQDTGTQVERGNTLLVCFIFGMEAGGKYLQRKMVNKFPPYYCSVFRLRPILRCILGLVRNRILRLR